MYTYIKFCNSINGTTRYISDYSAYNTMRKISHSIAGRSRTYTLIAFWNASWHFFLLEKLIFYYSNKI